MSCVMKLHMTALLVLSAFSGLMILDWDPLEASCETSLVYVVVFFFLISLQSFFFPCKYILQVEAIGIGVHGACRVLCSLT